MGDDRVRETHVEADVQVVGVDDPFMVGGYPLNEPGDSSLGAPPGETINCRCSAVYYYDGDVPDDPF